MAAEAYINEAMAQALKIAGRALVERQTATLDTPTATTTPAPTNTPAPTGGGQSPLLFFVALGFGVVFTNLWIIVGVKYCFRYNARNRALARGEDGEPINLEAVNPRPHRRRREKKLMTMDEVNERFPLTKYKTWMASRAHEGLSTAGGVNPPVGSRSATERDAEGLIPVSPTETKHSIESKDKSETTPPVTVTSPPTSPVPSTSIERRSIEVRRSADGTEKAKDDRATLPTLEEVTTNATQDPKHPDHHEDETDDDDDHIHSALGPDILDHPGDSCAICIDTLEDDDDIRGLTCGHAFHASCLDPWLTSRRACCPLCKADYYVPKPRAEGDAEAAQQRSSRRDRETPRVNLPQQPRGVWGVARSHPRIYLPGRFITGPTYVEGTAYDSYGRPAGQSRRVRLAQGERQGEGEQVQRHAQGQGWGATMMGRLTPWRREGRNGSGATPATDAAVTPAQLEGQTYR